MDSKYARAIAALNTAAKLAKDPNTQDKAVEFIRQNNSYFPKQEQMNLPEPNNISGAPTLVPLNSKNKKL